MHVPNVVVSCVWVTTGKEWTKKGKPPGWGPHSLPTALFLCDLALLQIN